MPRQIVYEGRKIKVAIDVAQTPGGTTVRRDVILHPGAVVVLPLVDDRHVCLLRNHRHAIGATLWEVPAGTLEPGEEPAAAARRELLEETGYRAEQWRCLGYLYASPGVLDEKLHLFVAQGLTPGEARPEPCEQLEPQVLPWDEAVRMALAGEVHDAKTITALLWWDRLRGA
ncbi:MAG TPA: NUDIX hydrolase [Gemmataceae bacterium]